MIHENLNEANKKPVSFYLYFMHNSVEAIW